MLLVEDVCFFLEYYWVCFYNFYSFLVELVFCFENIEDVLVFYCNFYGEVGVEMLECLYFVLLFYLMIYFDILLCIDFLVLYLLEKVYFNNCICCVWYIDVVWGFVFLYVVELVSCVNYWCIYEFL